MIILSTVNLRYPETFLEIKETSLVQFLSSINEFIGTWVYETAAYNFQISVFEDTEGKFKAYSSVSAQNGNFLDTGEKESPNIEIGTFNLVSKELQIIINSTYSEASFKASLKLIDLEKIEFKLGLSINDDVHYFPSKPTILTKQ